MIRRACRSVARLVGVAGIVAGGVVALTGALVSAADAASIDDSGWWSRANQDALVGSALVFPDVSPGQLLVEGTPEGATAIAALRATLPEGTGQPVLTLQASSAAGADTAVLLACQAGSGWTGAHAGAWSAKPNPDCETSVQGVPEGDAWTFDLAALQFDDQVNVVLVPGVEPNTTAGSAFRIVFDRPTEAAIQVSESRAEPDFEVPTVGGAGAAGSGSPAASGSTGGGFSSSFTPSPTPSFTPSTGSSSGGSGFGSGGAALPADEQGQTATAPVLQAANPLPPDPIRAASSGSDGRVLGILVALCAGGGAATVESGAAAVDIAAIPEEKRIGGLGRFRRVRDTPARRLGA